MSVVSFFFYASLLLQPATLATGLRQCRRQHLPPWSSGDARPPVSPDPLFPLSTVLPFPDCYATVQAAVDAVPDFGAQKFMVFIKGLLWEGEDPLQKDQRRLHRSQNGENRHHRLPHCPDARSPHLQHCHRRYEEIERRVKKRFRDVEWSSWRFCSRGGRRWVHGEGADDGEHGWRWPSVRTSTCPCWRRWNWRSRWHSTRSSSPPAGSPARWTFIFGNTAPVFQDCEILVQPRLVLS